MSTASIHLVPIPASAEAQASDPVVARVHAIFERQRAAYLAAPYPTLDARKRKLDALHALVRGNIAEIHAAINADFGHRSRDETLLTEIMGTLKSITYAKRKLRGWMKPRSRPVDINFKPATARLMPQPLGVVGVMAPWNYPFGLVLKPLISAIAAGNRVMIKPSEVTPSVAALLRTLLAKVFDEDEVAVIEGDARVAEVFIDLPFDHLLFTGSTQVGKLVMAAAAKHLTPLTLELGGKSPAIIDARIDMRRAVKSIATGKLLNCGQTCTAPDYVMVPKARLEEFVSTFSALAREMYPKIGANDDYTSVVNARHHQRLQHYLDDAAAKGARIVAVADGHSADADLSGGHKLMPTLVVEPSEDTAIMREEIFGPLLIVIGYDSIGEAIAYINRRPRPLALYVFTDDREIEAEVMANTVSGGVTVNDTLLHYTQESLPFGGVGHSGFGAYHGEKGFETFSHLKPIFRQSKLNALDMLRPPYNKTSRWLLERIIRMA
jgi:coniferyl-aldehyde dehydrogenase